MNVFACHPDPAVSATWLADQHVVKMTTESAQILSTVLHLRGVRSSWLYKPTHQGHPCTVAAFNDQYYYSWVVLHGLALAGEYSERYGRQHSSEIVIKRASVYQPPTHGTPRYWPLAMPEVFRKEDPHAAYCAYLQDKYDTWRQRGGRHAPRWVRVVAGNPFTSG